ncbi:MAG: DMT family transporter [Bacteroidota bacterium]
MDRQKAVVKGLLAIVIATSLWGFDGVVLTPRLYNLEASFVVMVLHILPFTVMNSFLFKQYAYLKLFNPTDYIALLSIALLGGTIGTLSIVQAMFLVNFENLTVVVLLQKLQPVFAITLATIFLKEKLKKHFLLWATLAILGGYFLTFELNLPNVNVGDKTAQAALLALLAAFCFGSTTVLGRKFLLNHDFQTITFYRYGFTTVILILYNLWTGKFIYFEKITQQNWLIFIIIAFTTGSGAIFLYYFGLKRVKASLATIAELCFPLSAILFDYLINNNKLSLLQGISATLMIFAIFKLGQEEVTLQNPTMLAKN